MTDGLQVMREPGRERIGVGDRVVIAPFLIRSNGILHLLCQIGIDVGFLQVLRYPVNHTLPLSGIHLHVFYNGARRNCPQAKAFDNS